MKRVFLAYAREDQPLKDRLLLAFLELQKDGLISIWHDLDGTLGMFAKEIERQIDESDIFMPLISQAFLDSDYCKNELKRAAGRWQAGKCIIAPVLLRTAPGWRDLPIGGDGKRLGDFNALPIGQGPLSVPGEPPHGYVKVARNLRDLLPQEVSGSDVNNTLDDICVLAFDALRWCLEWDSWMYEYSNDPDAPADLPGTTNIIVAADEMILEGHNNTGTQLRTRSRIRWQRHLHRFTYNLETPKEGLIYAFVLRLDHNGRCYFAAERFHKGFRAPELELKPQEMVAFIRDAFRDQTRQHRPQARGKKPRRKTAKAAGGASRRGSR